MLDIVWARLEQGQRTMKYPDGPPPDLPERFAGRPALDSAKCAAGCRACVEICPTDAVIGREEAAPLRIDLGRCIFCRECEKQCPGDAIHFTRDYQLAATRREDLVVGDERRPIAIECSQQIRRLFGRALRLRQVSAGGCNACEADTNVLGTVAWDLGRFGIQFVASPRRRPADHRTGNREYAAGPGKDLCRGTAAADRDCRGGLCRQRRTVHRSRGSP